MISEAQRALRFQGVGSSDIPILAGLLTKYGKDAEWLYQYKTGQIPEEPPTEQMQWGVTLEPIIRVKIGFIEGWSVEPDEETHHLIGREWAYCHPDGTISHHPTRSGRGVLEIKNSRFYSEAKGPTDYHLCQLQWQLAITRADYGVLAILEAGQKLHLVEVEPDQEIFERLVDMARAFWDRVEEYRNNNKGVNNGN
jgi:predicted phage-related endonuclease